jgi:hypothetical protein
MPEDIMKLLVLAFFEQELTVSVFLSGYLSGKKLKNNILLGGKIYGDDKTI